MKFDCLNADGRCMQYAFSSFILSRFGFLQNFEYYQRLFQLILVDSDSTHLKKSFENVCWRLPVSDVIVLGYLKVFLSYILICSQISLALSLLLVLNFVFMLRFYLFSWSSSPKVRCIIIHILESQKLYDKKRKLEICKHFRHVKLQIQGKKTLQEIATRKSKNLIQDKNKPTESNS